MGKASPNKTKSLKQPKFKAPPVGGPSTMERIATGGKKVASIAKRIKSRGKKGK